MAAQGSIRPTTGTATNVKLLWLAALLTLGLSLAAALAALLAGQSGPAPAASAAAETAAREQRIAFFEARAAADRLDFVSLNVLAGEYLQRARETGDVADYARAEEAASRSLEIVPDDNYGGLVLLGSVRLVQHDFAAAEALARKALPLKPAGPAAYGLLADAQVGLGRYDEAASTLETMAWLEGGLPALSRLADLAFLRGDRIDAVAHWQAAIDAAAGAPLEHQAWARVQLGVTYFALGHYDDAVRAHERALRLYPGYVHALAGLGQAKAAQGDWDGAIAAYEQAVARQPHPQYVAALGDVYAAAGQSAAAAEQYALVEAIDALYRDAGISTDLQIANFYSDHDRRLDAALTMAQGAYDAAPGVYAADALAWALYRNGRFAEASRYAAEALRLGTPEAAFYYHAALIREALGDREGAKSYLRQALALNPRFSPLLAEDASRRLAALEANR